MSRGLSIIQKRILCLAWREKFVTCQDILSLWGVPPGGVVDRGKYGAAHASLSRALTRLYCRGLIVYWQDKLSRYRTAVTLTDEGKSMAERITLEARESG